MHKTKKGEARRGEGKPYSDKSHMNKSFSDSGGYVIKRSTLFFLPLFNLCSFPKGFAHFTVLLIKKNHFPLVVLLLGKFKWSFSTPVPYNSDLLSQFSSLTFIQHSTARIILRSLHETPLLRFPHGLLLASWFQHKLTIWLWHFSWMPPKPGTTSKNLHSFISPIQSHLFHKVIGMAPMFSFPSENQFVF